MKPNQKLIPVVFAVVVTSSLFTLWAHERVDPVSEEISYTYEWVQSRVDDTGLATEVSTLFRGRRRDGSKVEILPQQAPDGRAFELRTVEDRRNGRLSFILPGIETKTTIPIERSTYIAAPPKDCGAGAGSRRAKIGDIDAVEFKKKQVGSLAVTFWAAPALACGPIRAVYESEGRVIAIEEARNIQFIEPDEELFSIPQEYSEASPKEARSRLHERFGTSPFNESGDIQQQMERAYWKKVGAGTP